MLCPKCGAEYRDGFTQCSDCAVPLVEELHAGCRKVDPWPFPPKRFLIWFVPFSLLFPFFLMWLPTRLGPGNFDAVVIFVDVVYSLAGLGGYWMIYQAIRYEERVGTWVLLAFVPFMFVWYRLARYPVRPKLIRIERQAEIEDRSS